MDCSGDFLVTDLEEASRPPASCAHHLSRPELAGHLHILPPLGLRGLPFSHHQGSPPQSSGAVGTGKPHTTKGPQGSKREPSHVQDSPKHLAVIPGHHHSSPGHYRTYSFLFSSVTGTFLPLGFSSCCRILPKALCSTQKVWSSTGVISFSLSN